MASQAALELVIGLKDNASSGIGKITGALGGLAKIGGAAILGGAIAGVAGLGAALAGGIADARAANIIMAQTEAVIASTGGAAGLSAEQVAEFAGSLSAASGKSLFGDDLIQQSSNLLLTFTNLKGGVLEAATAMSVDMAQALGGAPADAALQLGKALNDPIAGIGALSRVGVTFTEQQKEQIKTMVEAGDVAGAQAVILAELNKEFGGSAAAAAAADGGMTMFKDRMGELAESIGAQVLPMLNQFMAWLNSPEIQTAITNIGTGLVNAVVAAAAGFQSFMTTIQPVVGFVKDNLTGILAGLATMLIMVVVPAFVTWATAAGAAAIATIAALAPVLLPIAAIGAAVGLLVTAWDRDWGGMRTTITSWWNTSVQPILNTVKTWLDVNLPVALAALQTAWAVAWPIIQAAVQVVYDFLSGTVWPWIVSAFNTMKDTVLPALGTAFSTAWDAISTAVSTVYTYFSGTVWPWLETAMTNIGEWITTAQSIWSTAWGTISGAVSTAKDTISGAIATIKSLIDGAITKINALITAINSIPGVSIPSIPTAPTGGGASGFNSQPGRVSLSSLAPAPVVPSGGFGTRSTGATVSITVDARGATNPQEVEAAGYRGAQRALKEVGNPIRAELRSMGQSV